jgi:hypothetical protein
LVGSAGFLLAGDVVRHAKATLAAIGTSGPALCEQGDGLAKALEVMLEEIKNRNLQ